MLEQELNAIIEKAPFRKNVYNMIPENASKILDFGCGSGGLLLRLKRDKGCTDLHGLEVSSSFTGNLSRHVDRVWCVNLEHDHTPMAEVEGYFDYVIMHDVVEHLYDPWFTMMKVRRLLSPEGKLIVATPNFHFWKLQHTMHSGKFEYGPGLMHTGHLRWYTPASFIELLFIAGLQINGLYLEVPDKPDLSRVGGKGEIRSIQFPPAELQQRYPQMDVITVRYEKDIRKYYPVFFGYKMIAECTVGEMVTDFAPMTYDCPRLENLRRAIQLPYNVYNPPPMKLLSP